MIIRRVSHWPNWGRRSLFDELERMRNQMDLLTGGSAGGVAQEPFAGVFPLINVTEDQDNFYVRAELPGIGADELDISVTGDSLSIGGERKISEEDAQYHRREREAGKFSRIITLPSQVNTEEVEAQCHDGILDIMLPKNEAAKPKQITVKGS
jgi:HSP20 family protein